MNTRTTDFSRTLLVIAMAGAGGTALADQSANTECYDFSGLETGSSYRVGDTIDARHSLVRLKEFFVERGAPSQLDENGGTQQALVQNSSQARGSVPELRMVMINAEVTPQAPIRSVKLRFAENTGGVGPISNLQVNGEKRVIQGGLIGANGRVLGNNGAGRAVVTVDYHETAEGVGFNRGTLRMRATRGAIESWAIGGASQFFVDDVCITR